MNNWISDFEDNAEAVGWSNIQKFGKSILYQASNIQDLKEKIRAYEKIRGSPQATTSKITSNFGCPDRNKAQMTREESAITVEAVIILLNIVKPEILNALRVVNRAIDHLNVRRNLKDKLKRRRIMIIHAW